MTERQVKVTLSAQVNAYIEGMDKAARKTREVGTEAEKLAQQTQSFQLLGRTGLAMGAALGAGLAIAIGKAAEFDQAMSYVQATTHETAENMGELRAAALDAGARTVYSATEAANAINELGKAGVETNDILSGGLNASLDLAASSGIGVAEAAGIAATALKTFKLQGSDMAHVSDLMAAAAGKAMGGVSEMGQALSQVGQVAGSTGLSVDETTATLAAFASQGLLGSDAGTSFKSMLQRLTPQSAEAAEKMNELGISAYEAQGNFIGMEKFAGNLRTSLMGLTTEQRNSALATIFGSDAVRAATVLYSESSSGIADWTRKVNDSGYAAETAALRLDNLSGDVEKLSGSLDTALITSGSAANDTLRFLTQAANESVDAFNEMPEPVQGAALAVGAVTAAASLGSGIFFTAVPKVAEYRRALDDLGPSGQRAGRAISVVGKALGVFAAVGTGVALLDAWKTAVESAGDTATDLNNILATTGSSVELVNRAFKDESFLGYGGDADLRAITKDFGAFIDQVSAAPDTRWMGVVGEGLLALDPTSDHARDQFAKLGDSLADLATNNLPAAQAQFRDLAGEYNLSSEQLSKLIEMSPSYKKALTDQATAQGININSTDEAANKQALLKLAMGDTVPVALSSADAYLAAADEAQGLTDQVQSLISAINEANGIGQDAVSANIDYQNALAAVDEQIRQAREGVEGFSLGLDQSTQVGRDNMDMLNGLAGDYQSAAEKQLALDGNTENYIANLQAGRDAVLQRAKDLGATDEQIQFLSDHIVAMPSEKEVKIIADTSAAQASLNAFMSSNMNLVAYIRAVDKRADGGIREYANGGIDQIEAYANGMVREGIYAGRDPGIIKFAEPETGWEAFISGRPGREQENIGYALTALSRLGYQPPAPVKASASAPASGGDVWAPVFQLTPQPGRSLSDQAFEAARRLRIRR